MQNINFFDIYKLIGPCGVVIAILAVIAIFICLKNLIYTTWSWHTFQKDFLNVKIFANRCLKDYQGSNPFLSIIHDIVADHSKHSDDLRAEVGYLFNRNFRSVINGMSWIKMITVISPLLGLLGTVSGMLILFDTISLSTAQNPELLAKGIYQALITTVMGLVVAVPSLIIYYYLSLRMRNFYIEVIEHSYRAVKICANAIHQGESREIK